MPGQLDAQPLPALGFARFHVAPGRVALPDVRCDLIWADGDVLLAGPSTRARPVPSVGQVELVTLDPFRLTEALGCPAAALVDRVIPLAEVDRAAAVRFAALFDAGEGAALARRPSLDRPSRIDAAAQVLAAGGDVRAAAAAAEWSTRQLERRFVDAVGLSPRLYRRIVRLRRALLAARAGEGLAAAAQTAGFADQAHLTRETRALADRPPTALLPHVANVQDGVIALG